MPKVFTERGLYMLATILKARKGFRKYGISLEQGAVMFIEEFVRAKGDMAKSASATAERMQRVRNAQSNTRGGIVLKGR